MRRASGVTRTRPLRDHLVHPAPQLDERGRDGTGRDAHAERHLGRLGVVRLRVGRIERGHEAARRPAARCRRAWRGPTAAPRDRGRSTPRRRIGGRGRRRGWRSPGGWWPRPRIGCRRRRRTSCRGCGTGDRTGRWRRSSAGRRRPRPMDAPPGSAARTTRRRGRRARDPRARKRCRGRTGRAPRSAPRSPPWRLRPSARGGREPSRTARRAEEGAEHEPGHDAGHEPADVRHVRDAAAGLLRDRGRRSR